MLFEVIGLGCGFGPLNNRFYPPIGSVLYWMRPDTIRLPPWPNRVPMTKGTGRTLLDVALYAALLATIFGTLFADGTGPVPEPVSYTHLDVYKRQAGGQLQGVGQCRLGKSALVSQPP